MDERTLDEGDLHALLDGLGRTIVFRFEQRTASDGESSRLLYVSNNVERLLGVSRERAMADVGALFALVPSEAHARLEGAVAAFRAGERFAVEVPVTVQGSARILTLSATPKGEEDGARVWEGVATDVTELADEREEKRRLVEAMELTDDLVGTIDATGRVVFLNRAGFRMLDIPFSDDPGAAVAGLGVDALHPPPMQALYWQEIVPAVKRRGTWSGETTIVDRHGTVIPVSQSVVAHRDGGGRITHLSTVVRDMRARAALEAELRAAQARTEAIARELDHRARNLFALVPAMVQLSARSAKDVNELADAVRERLGALARSHALALAGGRVQDDRSMAGVAFGDLVQAVLEPYGNPNAEPPALEPASPEAGATGPDGAGLEGAGLEGTGGRVLLDGPAVRLTARDSNTASLILHELATNAFKYGALRDARGRLVVRWSANGDVLDMDWKETLPEGTPRPNGTPSAPAGTTSGTTSGGGFGTRLIDRLVRAGGGTVERSWDENGLRVRLRLSIVAEPRDEEGSAEPRHEESPAEPRHEEKTRPRAGAERQGAA